MSMVLDILGGLLVATTGAAWVLLTYAAACEPEQIHEALIQRGAETLSQNLPSRPLWYRVICWPLRVMVLLIWHNAFSRWRRRVLPLSFGPDAVVVRGVGDPGAARDDLIARNSLTVPWTALGLYLTNRHPRLVSVHMLGDGLIGVSVDNDGLRVFTASQFVDVMRGASVRCRQGGGDHGDHS